MKLNLKNVTICAADCVTPSLTARALKRSTDLCNFADAVLFSDSKIADKCFRTVAIEKLQSKNDYSKFILKDLVRYICTPFVLLVQWDGYVLEPSAWVPDFFEYDLIGAKWHWYKDHMTVGNGGFTLRSQKLLKAVSDERYPFVLDVPEDHQICRIYRPKLTSDFGIRFAPELLADRFSYERPRPDAPTFGFHGLFNMWRHVDDSEMVTLSNDFTPQLIRSIEFTELLIQYLLMRKFAVFDHLYICLSNICSTDEIQTQLKRFTNDEAFLTWFDRITSRLHGSSISLATGGSERSSSRADRDI
jgi:hypothetical protein